MSYQVVKSFFNGYRCGCCTSTWDRSPKWVDDLKEAIAQVPIEMPELDGDGGLTGVVVTDGSTGEVIAQGKLDWPTGGLRGAPYDFSRWSGYTPEGPFEIIVKGSRSKGGTVTDQTWSEILTEVRKKRHEEDVRKAKAELESAQANLKRLEG